jgi:hypothetical protein
MILFKRSISVLGSVFLAALLLATVAPRAAHAVAAALVQVTNTTASPVPTSDVAPLQAYEGVCFGSTPGYSVTGLECEISTPAGKRLVVQSASMLVDTPTGVVPVNSSVGATQPGVVSFFLPVVFRGAVNGGYVSNGTQSLQFYAEGAVNCDTTFEANADSNMVCSVAGYLVDAP